MLMVAATAGLPPRVLPVIHAIEGGKVGMVIQNANGTADLGVMQINTIWVPALAALAKLSQAETQQQLTYEPCFNIAASALIIRSYLAESRGQLLLAIGDYHSHTPSMNNAYRLLVENKAHQLFGEVEK